MLIFPAVVGIGIYARQMHMWDDKNMSYAAATNNGLNVIFAILISMWTTWVNESWGRIQCQLAHRWMVTDVKEYSFDRSKFKSAFIVDTDLGMTWKQDFYSYSFWRKNATHFYSFGCSMAIVAAFIGIAFWSKKIKAEKADGGETIPDWVPSVVLILVIIFGGRIFKKYLAPLMTLENHRKPQMQEEALTRATYCFAFFSSFIGYFICAFWDRNIGALAQNILMFIVTKQILINMIEIFITESDKKLKISRITREFDNELEEYEVECRRKRQL